MDIFDELLSGNPTEHLASILRNAPLQAIQNSLETFFSEYAILNAIIEENELESKIPEFKNKLKDDMENLKQDLSIRLMSDILSQGD